VNRSQNKIRSSSSSSSSISINSRCVSSKGRRRWSKTLLQQHTHLCGDRCLTDCLSDRCQAKPTAVIFLQVRSLTSLAQQLSHSCHCRWRSSSEVLRGRELSLYKSRIQPRKLASKKRGRRLTPRSGGDRICLRTAHPQNEAFDAREMLIRNNLTHRLRAYHPLRSLPHGLRSQSKRKTNMRYARILPTYHVLPERILLRSKKVISTNNSRRRRIGKCNCTSTRTINRSKVYDLHPRLICCAMSKEEEEGNIKSRCSS